MRRPKGVNFFDGTIECIPAEPDDHGGGFPGIQIEGFIYTPKALNEVIKYLQKREAWLTRQCDIHGY